FMLLAAIGAVPFLVQQLLSRVSLPAPVEDPSGPSAFAASSDHTAHTKGRALVVMLTLGITVIVLGFFILVVPDRNRNYGGWTSGPRWLMWLTPLWLLTLLPAADWLAARRWRRGLGYILLAISVFSASYPAFNPWRHPWLYHLLESAGWVQY